MAVGDLHGFIAVGHIVDGTADHDDCGRIARETSCGLNRLFGLPGKTASAVRRFGISAVDRIAPLKERFMAEARGESGELPKLLMGEAV